MTSFTRFFLTFSVVSLLAAPFSTWAQESVRLPLERGVRIIPLQAKPPSASDLSIYDPVSDAFYGLAVFNRPLNRLEREEWQKKGLNLGTAVAASAYYAVLPRAKARAVWEGNSSLTWVGLGSDRRSMRLDQGCPEWALLGSDRARFRVLLMGGRFLEPNLNQLSQLGYAVEAVHPAGNEMWVDVLGPSDPGILGHSVFVLYLQEAEEPGEPENFNARSSHRINSVQPRIELGYNGSGVVVGHGDDGAIGPHIDYQGRMLADKSGPSSGTHGDHVAGTILGGGNLDPRGAGMAPGADLVYYTYPDNLNDVDLDFTQYGVRITNSSYSNGCNAGYTSFSAQVDGDVFLNPGLQHVFSAGNNGTQNCGYGAGNVWGNITGGHKVGKNTITVANLNANDGINSSSSRGPAADGRIKPDVAAVGTNVYSTVPPNDYDSFTGTSMACPGTAGTLAVLYQAYRETHAGADPPSALLKGYLLNTADDLGNSGPDFIHGYGRINARAALEDLEANRFLTQAVDQGQSRNFVLNVPPGTSRVRMMLIWTDPAASPVAQRDLVNNLDFSVNAGGTVHLPWVLDPTSNPVNLASPAVQAVDSLNNIEQITIDNPVATLNLSVVGTAVPQGPQEFYIVYRFEGNEPRWESLVEGMSLVPGQSEILRWWSPTTATGTISLDYSTDQGQSWTSIVQNMPSATRWFTWTPPSSLFGSCRVRLTQGGLSVQTPDLPLLSVPQGFSVNSACSDTIEVQWLGVPGATAYDLFVLGNRYMDSVGTAAAQPGLLRYKIGGIQGADEHWIAVRARNGFGIGQRSRAINKPVGTFNCQIPRDIEAEAWMSPAPGLLSQCMTDSVRVGMKVRNSGTQPLYGYSVILSLNGPVNFSTTLMMSDTLNPGEEREIYTSAFLNLPSGTYSAVGVAQIAQDGNVHNDSLMVQIITSPLASVSGPFLSSLENLTNCASTSDCEVTVCSLDSFYANWTNGVLDDIDWRTDNGGTPSSGTGPAVDAFPGNSAGKYLYLEASGSCTQQTAVLQSGCIELVGMSSPELRFAYHMFGANQGTLRFDLIADGQLIEHPLPPISGNQGNVWKWASLDLRPYMGQKIALRFTGTTGNDFDSDMALDAFIVSQVIIPPTPQFSAESTLGCVGVPMEFFENCLHNPDSFSWSFSPSTVGFVQGTGPNSANPVVVFQQPGVYSVQLAASNANGADSLLITNYITISGSAPFPYAQSFQVLSFPPSGMRLDNPDGLNTWAVSNAPDPNGITRRSVRMNFLNYGDVGATDRLLTLPLQVPMSGQPALVFRRAHAQGNNGFSYDGLVVEASRDCGLNYDIRLFEAFGNDLATTAPSNLAYVPQPSDWVWDTLSLVPYLGEELIFSFTAINGSGNYLYLDDVQWIDLNQSAGTGTIVLSDNDICQGDTIQISAVPPIPGAQYTWRPGPGLSMPQTTGPGPLDLTAVLVLNPQISLEILAPGGFTELDASLTIRGPVTASFGSQPTQNNLERQFFEILQGLPTQFEWDFGDGTTSTASQPIHQYATGGTYTVRLTGWSECGADTAVQSIGIWGIGLDDASGANWKLYPNPVEAEVGKVYLESPWSLEGVELFDLSGRQVEELGLQATSIGLYEMSLPRLSVGTYLLKLRSEITLPPQLLIVQ
ncbi:S8 family serine peptidase [bacterium]|nr:S8 family serine peptidase [bacterium]